jgi:SAM-dependent methyltransferase
MLRQRTQYEKLPPAAADTAFFSDVAAYAESLRPFLPRLASGMRLVDIGCGIGFSLLGLAKIYGPSPTYIGVDRGSLTEEVVYGFSETPSSYNSFAVTAEILSHAGIPDSHRELVDIEREPFPIGPVDVVTSILAWGFHFPLKVYLPQVSEIVRPGGVLVVDVRRGLQQERELEAQYKLLESFPMQKSDRLILQRRGA